LSTSGNVAPEGVSHSDTPSGPGRAGPSTPTDTVAEARAPDENSLIWVTRSAHDALRE